MATSGDTTDDRSTQEHDNRTRKKSSLAAVLASSNRLGEEHHDANVVAPFTGRARPVGWLRRRKRMYTLDAFGRLIAG